MKAAQNTREAKQSNKLILQNMKRNPKNESISEEETLATLLYVQHRRQMHSSFKRHDENEIACAVKEWKEKGQAPTERYDLALLQEAARVLSAEQKLQANSQSLRPLPSILSYTIEESLAKDQKKQKEKESKVPAIIVELLQDSIKVFKSTFNGFGDVFQPVVQSRGTSALRAGTTENLESEDSYLEDPSEESKALHLKANYALLQQKIKEQYLQYELLRDSDNSISLLISAPECLRKSKAVLKKGKHTIAAQGFNMQDGLLKFKNLKVGKYSLEFRGVMEYTIEIKIHFRLNTANTKAPQS